MLVASSPVATKLGELLEIACDRFLFRFRERELKPYSVAPAGGVEDVRRRTSVDAPAGLAETHHGAVDFGIAIAAPSESPPSDSKMSWYFPVTARVSGRSHDDGGGAVLADEQRIVCRADDGRHVCAGALRELQREEPDAAGTRHDKDGFAPQVAAASQRAKRRDPRRRATSKRYEMTPSPG